MITNVIFYLCVDFHARNNGVTLFLMFKFSYYIFQQLKEVLLQGVNFLYTVKSHYNEFL